MRRASPRFSAASQRKNAAPSGPRPMTHDQHAVARRERDRSARAAAWQSEREHSRDEAEQADDRRRKVRRRDASAASSWPR